jgi:hypothetical protein
MKTILPCFRLHQFFALSSHSIHNRLLYFGQDFKGNQQFIKEIEMNRHIFLRILAGFVLLAAIAGVTFLAYQSGVTHASMVTAQTSGNTAPAPYPYSYGWFWPPFLFPFGCFVPLIALFLICLAFSAFRFMLWGPRRWEGHRMHGHHGPWGGDSENGVPPMFDEWHKRAHGGKEQVDENLAQK